MALMALAGHGVAVLFFSLYLLLSFVAAQHPKHTIGLFENLPENFFFFKNSTVTFLFNLREL
jgi:hypothetical protein